MSTHSYKQGIDLPVPQQLSLISWSTNYHGCAFVYDNKRYIYWLQGYASTSFYRYDIYTDGWTQLASVPTAPSSSAYASDLTICHTRQRIYAVLGGQTTFYYYDIEADAWSAALTALPATATAGATVKHTCSFHNAAGNDDYVYYVRGDATEKKLRRYSISGNSWSEVGVDILTTAPGAGAQLFWNYGVDPDMLLMMVGNSTRDIYQVSIAGAAVSGLMRIKPNAGSVAAGSIMAMDNDLGELFWVETASRNINKFKLKFSPSDTGTALGTSTATSLVTAKTWEDGKWVRAYVTITGGTGAGQTRAIQSNSPTTLVVSPNFTTPPDATSTFEIKWNVFDYGPVASSTTTVITDSTKAWLTNAWIGCKVKIIAGTGAGQERYVTTNTATTLTVTVAFSPAPDSTSKYEIIGYRNLTESQIPLATSASYYGNTMAIVPVKGLYFLYYARKTSVGEWWRYLITSP